MPGNIISFTPDDIAKWPAPNHIDPYQRTWLPAYAGTLYAVGTLMVVTRIALRATKKAGVFGLDDILLITAWLAGTVFTAISIINVKVYDGDRRTWDVPLNNFEYITLMAWIGELTFLVQAGALKISVLLFYRRLVHTTCSKYWMMAVYASLIFTAGYTLAFIILLFVNCSPTDAYWRAFNLDYMFSGDYTCINTTPINLLAGIFSIISDIYAVVLPCVITWNFTMPRRQKVALNAVFGVGLFVAAASSVRTYYLYSVGNSLDIISNIFFVFVWAQLELQLATICVCAPAMRVLLRTYLNPTLTRLRGSSNDRYGEVSSTNEDGIAFPDKLERGESRYSQLGRNSFEMEDRNMVFTEHLPEKLSPDFTDIGMAR